MAYGPLVLTYFVFYVVFLKLLSGMANSEDPDQTAPSGAV